MDSNTLAENLLSDPIGSSNNVQKLFALLRSPDAEEDASKAAIRALQIFLSESLSQQAFSKEQGTAGSEDAVEIAHLQWLNRQYKAFQEHVLQAFCRPFKLDLQLSCLTATLELARSGHREPFDSELFCSALETMLCSKHSSDELLGLLAAKHMDFCDVRYNVFKTIHRLANRAASSQDSLLPHLPHEDQEEPEVISRKIYLLLSQAKPLLAASSSRKADAKSTSSPSWCGALEQGIIRPSDSSQGSKHRSKRRRKDDGEIEPEVKGKDSKVPSGNKERSFTAKWATPFFQRKAFSDAWLAFFTMQLPEDVFRKALGRLHEHVIPHMSNPHSLADLLTGALDAGGLIGMLALHAIFVLVTKYSLEYPGFYARLYQLLQPSAFLAKHRSRFFQLADVFLSSQLVPAYTMAAFAKRFARLALTAPPAGSLLALAFVHNIIRRHRACNVLLDRQASKGPSADLPGQDPYLEDEADPAQSRAIDSSLWEVKSLCNHYYVQVAVLAKQILEKDLTDRKKTAELDISPLVTGSYSQLASSELQRRIKQVSTAFYPVPPTKLFGKHSAAEFAAWAF